MNRKSFGAGKRDGGKPAGAEQPCGADGVPATAGQDLGAAGEEHANDGGEAKGEAEAVAVGPVTEIELNEYMLDALDRFDDGSVVATYIRGTVPYDVKKEYHTYVTKYVPKFSDSMVAELLNDDGEANSIAASWAF